MQGIRKEEFKITYSSTSLSRRTLFTNKARRSSCTCFSSSANRTLVTTRPTDSFFTRSTRGTRRASDTLWANVQGHLLSVNHHGPGREQLGFLILRFRGNEKIVSWPFGRVFRFLNIISYIKKQLPSSFSGGCNKVNGGRS